MDYLIHFDHVKIQMPYALMVAIIAVIVGYLPAAVWGINLLISLILGCILALLAVRYIGKPVEEAIENKQSKLSA